MLEKRVKIPHIMNHSKERFQYPWEFPRRFSSVFVFIRLLIVFHLLGSLQIVSPCEICAAVFIHQKLCSCHNGFETILKFKRDADCCGEHNRFVLTKTVDIDMTWNGFLWTAPHLHELVQNKVSISMFQYKNIFYIQNCSAGFHHRRKVSQYFMHHPYFVFQPHR